MTKLVEVIQTTRVIPGGDGVATVWGGV